MTYHKIYALDKEMKSTVCQPYIRIEFGLKTLQNFKKSGLNPLNTAEFALIALRGALNAVGVLLFLSHP